LGKHEIDTGHSTSGSGISSVSANEAVSPESISNRGQGKADALLSDRLAPSWNTILSPKLTVSTPGFEGSTRCSGGAFSCDPTAPMADLHVVLQIGFDWTDFHLHRFRIRKKDYAVPRLGGLACHDGPLGPLV